MIGNSRKEFHFDLDDEALKQYYVPKHGGKNAWKSAWSDIRKYMEQNGFEHTQYSGYESLQAMSYEEAYIVLDGLKYQFPWFSKCAQIATLTEIGERHDVLSYFAPHREPNHAEEITKSMPTVSLKEEAETARDASKAMREAGGYEPPHKENPQR